MQRVNFFHGQTVTEAELDAVFDDVEDAERNMAIDTGHAQVDDGATPGPAVYGGILSGLVVTGVAGENHVHVSLGVAKDDQGRRIYLSSAASVLLSNVGLTTAGDTTDAQGDGAATTSIAAGAYSVLTLWLVYVETLTNPRVDLLGSTVYYDIAEDFRFELQLGDAAGYNHANVLGGAATPNRSAILDDKVLLADIIVTNNAGTVQVAAVAPPVCTKDEDWDDLTGNYANLTGRRSDWIACDQGADFPLFDAYSLELRQPTAREAIYDLVKKLQAWSASPTGSSLIGAATALGSQGQTPNWAAEALFGQSVSAQLTLLQTAVNKKVSRGGDLVQSLYDDFHYGSRVAADAWAPDLDTTSKWGSWVSGAGGGLSLLTEPGGIVRLTTVAAVGAMVGIQTGATTTGGATDLGWWKCAAGYPLPACGCRFRLPTAVAGKDIAISFVSTGGVARADFVIVGGVPQLTAQDAAGHALVVGGVIPWTFLADSWYEIWLSMGTGSVQVSYNNGTIVAVDPYYVTLVPGDDFGADTFFVRVAVASTSGNAEQLDVDTVTVGERSARPVATP